MIDQVRDWIDEARRIVVLTGAGISTDSGIPDFRGPQGPVDKNPLAEKMSNIHYYLADPEVRKLSWQNRMSSPAWTAKPNAGPPFSLVALRKETSCIALITQNIDELHQLAGNSPEKVIEVHGTMRRVMCMSCGMRAPMQKALDRVRAGERRPAMPRLRRDPEERHHQLRPAARARGDRPGDAGRRARPTSSSPSAPRCRSIRSPARSTSRATPARSW
jgi:NAD-dependent deacetylase